MQNGTNAERCHALPYEVNDVSSDDVRQVRDGFLDNFFSMLFYITCRILIARFVQILDLFNLALKLRHRVV